MKCAAFNPNISSAFCICKNVDLRAISCKMMFCFMMCKDMFYCPWRATATTAMVRSTMSVPTATIGVIQLAARMLATSTSIAAMPT
jgi:hypothetical protein